MKRKTTPQQEAQQLIRRARKTRDCYDSAMVSTAIRLLPVLAAEIERLEQRIKEQGR